MEYGDYVWFDSDFSCSCEHDAFWNSIKMENNVN